MTKQEEISEGTIAFWQDTGEKLTRGLLINLVPVYLRWLQSKGGVIKVKRELPNNLYEPLTATKEQNDMVRLGYLEGRQDMLKAGYVAVEPLI